jgi:hypothetical protein
MSYWEEIKADFVEGADSLCPRKDGEVKQVIYVDVWKSECDNEEGCTIAKIISTKRGEVCVIYLNDLARTDAMAQPVIQEALKRAQDEAKFDRKFGGFTMQDILNMYPTLTPEQAYEVMENVERRANYDQGLSWHCIEYAVSIYHPGLKRSDSALN